MLKIHDMTFKYSGQNKPALEQVNFEVEPGNLVLVTGPSGSGKSTLLHCINGLATIHYGGKAKGHISIAGREISDKSLWEISELAGTVFQNPDTQFFQLTVEDEIVFSLERAGLDKTAIEKRLITALLDIEIAHLRHRDIFTLSSGEKQKVALASILAMDQPLLLFDEPTANLDIQSIHELRRILYKLKSQGRTIVVSEHRLWYLRELADQTIVINEGRLVYNGKSERLACQDFRSDIGLRIWDKSPAIPEFRPDTAAAADHQSVLKVCGLSVKTGSKKKIINDINFSLNRGSCIALMGHNGAGKTMLSRTLTGLQKENKGTISVESRILKNRNRIEKVTCVTQHAEQQLFSDTVLGELLLQPDDNMICRETAGQFLEKHDLVHLKDRHPQTLSGGEKQRLAIAASMVMNPEILILDEPTSGMDMLRMKKLSQEIRTLCRLGILVIIITHDIELVCLCSEKILWMEKGRITKTVSRDDFGDFLNNLIKIDSIERHENEMYGSLLK